MLHISIRIKFYMQRCFYLRYLYFFRDFYDFQGLLFMLFRDMHAFNE